MKLIKTMNKTKKLVLLLAMLLIFVMVSVISLIMILFSQTIDVLEHGRVDYGDIQLSETYAFVGNCEKCCQEVAYGNLVNQLSSRNMAFAGDEIRGGNRIGTVTANAICNVTGQFGVITNQHIARTYNMNVGGSRVGRSAAHQQQRGGTIDAAFVPFENQMDWLPTPYARYDSHTFRNIRIGTEAQIQVAHAQQ